MNPRDTSGCSQNPSPITKPRRPEESKSRRPFFRSLLGVTCRRFLAPPQSCAQQISQPWPTQPPSLLAHALQSRLRALAQSDSFAPLS